MKILGLSAFYHDSAATLLDEGEILASSQEERWTRKKHDPSFPIHSIKFCLDKMISIQNSKLSYQSALKQINYIVYYDKPFLSFERLLETYLDYAPFKGLHSFRKSLPLWLRYKLNIRASIKKALRKHFHLSKKEVPQILFNYHHLSHCASAFYPSPYEKSAILCVDGVGEWATSSAWIGEREQVKPLWQINFPDSLGLLYSSFTEYCGFKVNSGEYKLMGLAPYGEPKFVSLLKENLIEIKEDGSFQLNKKYFSYSFSSQKMCSPKLYELLKKASRKKEEDLDIHYLDVACSIQKIIEEVLIKMAKNLFQQTKLKNLCMAGGVALNCVANEKILSKTPFESLWIQPAAGDAGGSLGATLATWHIYLKKPRVVIKPDAMKGSLLGPSFSSQEIEKILIEQKTSYQKLTEQELIDQVIKEILEGKVVGWFQDAMEFGPRALGCRSILADSRHLDMQIKLNQKIKFRESFRPFAMSILEEKIEDFFETQNSPYMLMVSYIKPNERKNEAKLSQAKGLKKQKILKSSIPSCTHVDYSCRIQTVGKQAPARFRKLLWKFYEKTNCPGLINTSFNVRGEPIVCKPYEAYRCFRNTDMDSLFIGDFFLKKEDQKETLTDFYTKNLEKD
ncbi:MAG: carbamoyltransferase [Bdellovibrionales bacterium]|nr:carbamoyltransferase [Bdellovibrionales bacterium]